MKLINSETIFNRSKLSYVPLALVGMLLVVDCGRPRQSASNANGELFSLTNSVMEGQPVQVVRSTFGLRIVPRRSNVFIGFGTNDASINVFFDQVTLKPRLILTETPNSSNRPGQWVFDYNADAIPDVRQIKGEEDRQLYYLGDWYYYQATGTNSIITYGGKKIEVSFDGSSWRKVSD